ncbi:hypothetical protein GIB67_000347 [Kingdonia uniflora]|uniref:Pentatricopeptide repeat-containing protein n=1 Tax=Kingdonia uniflora TaxID=39325 RepID=A0A7J7LCM2_9MAGN|nr:hypothetical protein GIB67_000347 [Kingdonia uniflora]
MVGTKSGFGPNSYTFPFLINACARLLNVKIGEEIHNHVVKNGFESDIFIRNSLIHLYSIFGKLERARVLFGESSDRDLVSFNTMVNGYTRGGRPMDALGLFREMRGLGIEPDEFTIVALLSACSILSDSRTGKQIHLWAYKELMFRDSKVMLSALIDMYAKCGMMDIANRVFDTMRTSKTNAAWSSMVSGYTQSGEIEIARRYFDQMFERDLVSWTAMISGYTQTGRYSEALELFMEMEGVGVKPDEITLVSTLSACAGLGDLELGKRIHHQYLDTGFFTQNHILATATANMYAKCGNIEAALNIFNGVPEKSKTVFLYNAVITGLAQHGISETAIMFFKEMGLAGLRPDEITFVGVLCACSHGGLVEEGKKIFESMLKDHGIKPNIEHNCCMVDLLGRSGRLVDALEFIQSMPFEIDSVIWRSLLGACKIHGNVEIGEIAGKRLLELEPEHGAHYVLLSNMFTDAKRWEDSKRVRKLMEDKCIIKPPGSSK